MTIPQITPYACPTEGELPESRAPWQPDPGRAVLLVHDMQRYFLDFFDPLADPLKTALDNTRRLRAACAAADVPVVWSAQPADVAPETRGLLNALWGEGLRAHPDRAGFASALSPVDEDKVLRKTRYSAFVGTDLAPWLLGMGRDQLWICGVYAHIGCLATAFDACMRDIEPVFIIDAMADFCRADHERAALVAAGCCATVASTSRVLEGIREGYPEGPAACDAPARVPAKLQTPAATVVSGVLVSLLAETDRPGVPLSPLSDALALSLREIGLDSIRLMELADRLESLGIVVDPADLLGCETLQDLYGLCEAEGGARR